MGQFITTPRTVIVTSAILAARKSGDTVTLVMAGSHGHVQFSGDEAKAVWNGVKELTGAELEDFTPPVSAEAVSAALMNRNASRAAATAEPVKNAAVSKGNTPPNRTLDATDMKVDKPTAPVKAKAPKPNG